MAPIDYSKWDSINADSEPEESSQQAPAPNPTQPSAPATSQSASASTTAAAHSDSEPIRAVIVRCVVDKVGSAPWSATTVPADHAVFSQPVSPIPALIEVPLVVFRVGTRSANRADLDCQIATYLNIDADSGFAPPEWRSHVGTVIVARKDRKPLPPQHLEGVWMYCHRILDLFGEGEGAPRSLYNRQAFEIWWARYCGEQKQFRGGKGGEEDPDDWREVKSPYEV